MRLTLMWRMMLAGLSITLGLGGCSAPVDELPLPAKSDFVATVPATLSGGGWNAVLSCSEPEGPRNVRAHSRFLKCRPTPGRERSEALAPGRKVKSFQLLMNLRTSTIDKGICF